MAGRFLSPLVVENVLTQGTRNARLARPLIFLAADGRRFEVPAGFETDLATIPQLAQAVIGKWECHAWAAVLHDWLYSRQITTRREADRLFLEAMVACRVGLAKRAVMWASVRACGWRYWQTRVTRGGDMHLTITNGRLDGVKFVAANSFGGPLKPELIILHDTAGRLNKGSSVDWFRSKACTTSAHVVIERDGTIVQMVPFNRKAFHAGQSSWKGRRFCNSFAVGIEIVNPGKMDRDGRAWFGKATEDPLQQAFTKEHGSGWWLAYTPAQIAAVKALCRALVAEYPDCNDITTHWAVSPGRKIDTNPLMPLEEVKAYAFGETEEEAEVADVPPAPLTPPAPPPSSMAQSSTGNTALAVGAGGGVTAANEVSAAFTRLADTGKSITLADFLLALATSPTFWLAAFTVAASVYIWIERRAKLVRYGV